ncbi:hypothetical protein MHB50_05870 [Siminovitchia sp. FSL H7-0308]|uniref:Uncharacterized protein n=1 Tax=Siminovitchia thermophila TaxID=1245522 RepID=A0ABS2R1F1_9BACI|nr:hypothetical protein [Siminovitchia thermophila]MBM7713463.1 hypothetical protein [Siminovitchia thermophila]
MLPSDVVDLFPMSDIQQGMVFHNMRHEGCGHLSRPVCVQSVGARPGRGEDLRSDGPFGGAPSNA